MRNAFLIFLVLSLFISITQAQQTTDEWLAEAELALEEGRTTDAGSAYSNAANKQLEKGEYEAAAENFKKAAAQFRKDGRVAQANAETTNAAAAYESAALKASENGDHEKAAELYDKAAEQYDADNRTSMAENARRKAEDERQHLVSVTTPKGTGRTTGHIATLSVTNNSNAPVTVTHQTFYIPSDRRYQSYVGRIPEAIEIGPGKTSPIDITGYCTDVTKPPSTTVLPPINEWVAVDPPTTTTSPPTNPIKLITENVVPPFRAEDIPSITSSPGFKSGGTGEKDKFPSIVITWPGKDIPVGGTIDPEKDPVTFAPVIISIVELIEAAGEVIQKDPKITTPFANNPDREREAIVQQTIWIVMAEITGEEYEKTNFADNTYEQYSNATSIPVAAILESDKEKLDKGVDEFWDVFMATGLEAKVLKANEGVQIQVFPHLDKDKIKEELEKQGSKAEGDTVDPESGNDDENPETETEPEEDLECICDSLTFTLSRDFGGLDQGISTHIITKFTANTSSSYKTTMEVDEEEFNAGIQINISNIRVYCSDCGDTPCEYYSGAPSKMDESDRNKVEIKSIKVNGGKETADSRSVSDNGLSLEIVPDKKAKNYYLTFYIRATCMAADCDKSRCNRYIQVEVKKKEKK